MSVAVSPRDLWRSRLDIPNYEIGEAARYADVSASTVGRWHQDTTLPEREARRRLSYYQLIELAVVSACRKAGMKLTDIRSAREFLTREFKTDHPFATLQLKTDGVDLLKDAGEVQGVKHLLTVNRGGQLAWKHILAEKFLEFDYESGVAARWHVAGKRSPIIIDPRIRFGAPNIKGVPTWLVRDRWVAGEQPPETASEYKLTLRDVREALIFEGIEFTPEQRKKWLN
ncbi:MAG: DUF433 domain-containing protein [Sphingosinicella sp.]